MSRVIHLRTSNKNIAACYQLMEVYGLDTKVPMSSAVNTILTGFLRARYGSEINEYDEAEAERLVDRYTAGRDFVPKDSTIDLVDGSNLSEGEIVEALDENDHSIIAQAVAQVNTGGVEASAPEDLPEVSDDKPPWEGHPNRLNYDDLRQAFPKDILIKVAKDNPMIQRAIEVAYATYAKDQWGTAHIGSVVKGLALENERWRAAQEEKKPLDN